MNYSIIIWTLGVSVNDPSYEPFQEVDRADWTSSQLERNLEHHWCWKETLLEADGPAVAIWYREYDENPSESWLMRNPG